MPRLYCRDVAAERAPVAGIDIDGVLADPGHRRHYLERRPKNWGAFFRRAHRDPPLPEGIATVTRLIDEGVTPVFVSGRPEWLRHSTERWLAAHGLPDGPLHLRPNRDYRPAAELKVAVYRRIAVEFDVRVIVDDDAAVVTRLREAAFTVTMADWFPAGRPSGVLAEAQEEEGRT